MYNVSNLRKKKIIKHTLLSKLILNNEFRILDQIKL